MSKESYVRGFRKAAEAAGVDPSVLAKYVMAGGKDVLKWNPIGPEGYVGNNAVTNRTGIYHLPPPVGKDGWAAGKKPLVIFRPGEITRMPSSASVTNDPNATYSVSRPGESLVEPLWKRVKREDGTVVNAPSSFDALINLQSLANQE